MNPKYAAAGTNEMLNHNLIYFAGVNMPRRAGNENSALANKEEAMEQNEAIQQLSAELGADVSKLDMTQHELKRLLSEFRQHVRSTRSKKRRSPRRYARFDKIEHLERRRRMSYALHHGLLPGCICKCRMEDSDAGRMDAMECLYEPSSLEVLD
jgi:hypothetical protein